jgi:hypothetical protein
VNEHTDPARDVEALAEELCRYDDSLHHMEATDDFPCWHCKTKAHAVNESDWVARVRAETWAEGYRSGYSNAMRRMSDEPNAPTTPNPYRIAGGA